LRQQRADCAHARVRRMHTPGVSSVDQGVKPHTEQGEMWAERSEQGSASQSAV
jgi:hypothetical protein